MADVLRRNPALMIATGLVAIVTSLALLMSPARAHSASVSASTAIVCDSDGLVLSWVAESWSQTDPGGRHPNIVAELSVDGGSYVLIGNGPFTDANGRSISGSVDIPSGALTLELRVTPDPAEVWEGTEINEGGDLVSLTVPPFAEFCGAVTPDPSPSPDVTPSPGATETPTETPVATGTERVPETPSPTAAPTATPETPTATAVETETPTPTATPTATQPTPTPAPVVRSAAVACVDTGIAITVLGGDGDVFEVFVDGAPTSSIDVGASGAGSATLDQEPGETNVVEVRFGTDLLAEGSFTCVEGSSSPGTPQDPPATDDDPADPGDPEVLGQVTPNEELAETGVEAGLLGIIGVAMLAAGAMLVLSGLSHSTRRRLSR